MNHLQARWLVAVVVITASAVPATADDFRATIRMTGIFLSVIALDIVTSDVDSETMMRSIRQNMEDVISRDPDGYTAAEREASTILLDTLEIAIDNWERRAQELRQQRLNRTGGPRPAPAMTPVEGAANRRRLTGN